MASTSEPPSLAEYDVFLSFRGLDTRRTFTDYLYHDLKDAGIRVFRDDDELYKGKELASELPRAISNSRICIAIFSKNFANSAWCLREVAHMVECWKKTKGAVEILPIFYDVDVREVKLRSGSYKDDVEKHRTRFPEETIVQWKNALRQMGRMKGWTVNDAKGHGELVKSIVQDLLIKLKIRYRNLPSKVVGLDDQVDILTKLIDVDSEGVKFIIIHGMGGMGKTTLAKVVFNRLANCYEGCCFLDDVQDSTKTREILSLQKKLLSDVFNPKAAEIVDDTNGGINRIRGQMSSKRVLIVLDNVDEGDQLPYLAGRSDWFGSGSRIIITTRNQGVLAGKGEPEKYFYHELKQMGIDDALQLFSWHAFRKDSPPSDYDDLSQKIVYAVGRLPLALAVIGSMLFCTCRNICKCKTIWRETFNKLRKSPDRRIQDILMVSIEKLEVEQRQVFLDIACFLINKDGTNAVYMWSDCDFYPDTAIRVLCQRSLLKFTDNNEFWMHDLIRDIGRGMVREENVNDPGKRSRVWDSKEAKDIIEEKRGTDAVEALWMDYYEGTITHDTMSTLHKLRFLRIPGANLKGDFKDHLPNLRWLVWHHVPYKFKATSFYPKNLVVLDLFGSSITEDWGGWKQLKVANKLKVLDLTNCFELKRTPDLSSFLQLEKLILVRCYNLACLDPSICLLKQLTHLNMRSCESLGKLPKEIGSLDSLEYLSLAHCTRLQKLPSSVGDLKSLVELDIELAYSVTQLPDSIGNIKNLKVLRMGHTPIRKLPPIGLLENLEIVEAWFCGDSMFKFPKDMEQLSSLKILNFSNSCFDKLPKSFVGLSLLEVLHLKLPDDFKASQFPKLPSSLKSLEIINISFNTMGDFVPDLSNLTNLTKLRLDFSECSGKPDLWWIGKLSKLEWMKLCHGGITTLPKELATLTMLKDIVLNCPKVKCVPGLPSQLGYLYLERFLTSRPLLETIPCLKDLGMFKVLEMRDCNFYNVGDEVRQLSGLSKLSIDGYPYRDFNLSNLRKLNSLHIHGCSKLVEIQLLDLISLQRVWILSCPKLEKIQGIDQLPALDTLDIAFCDSLVLDISNLNIESVRIQECPNVRPRCKPNIRPRL